MYFIVSLSNPGKVEDNEENKKISNNNDANNINFDNSSKNKQEFVIASDKNKDLNSISTPRKSISEKELGQINSYRIEKDETTIIEYEIKESLPSDTYSGRDEKSTSEDISIYEGRYCMSCHIDIPLRTKHCQDCDMCVATFDHHCSWISKCVGEKNKLKFLNYLFVELLYLILVFNFLLTAFRNMSLYQSISNFLLDHIYLILLTSINGLFIVFVFTLLKFQLNLALKNQTTWENLSWHKIQYMVSTTKSQKSPFSKDWKSNLSYVFCYESIIKRSNTKFIVWKNETNLDSFKC